MEQKYETHILVKVAQMYYLYGNKQSEIAKELNVSRSSISLMLTEAKERGIVEVKYIIKNPLLNNEKLAKQMENIFNVSRCIVVPSSIKEPEIATKLAAERTGDVLNEELSQNIVVGIAWGSTCYEFMSSYRPIGKIKNISIVPLIGASDKAAYKYQLNEMVRKYAEKVNGVPSFIYAPAIPESLEDKDLYLRSAQMKSIISKWQNIDIAIISVGALPGHLDFDEEDLNNEYMNEFEQDRTKPVGDLCARQINIYGEFINDKYNEKIIGITEENLRKVTKVICTAAGINKTFSIIGALRTGIIHTFICDEQTAKYVLQMMETKRE